ncbi:MAG: DUF3459 domain-containing protein, partial [Lachnospiraceae bacterium]|nr:DUF3459 domain-containing protein [Lachnospiraceae bacterium]
MTKAIKPDFYLLGEIWHDSIEWLRGDEYDAVMNYPLATAISNYWVYEDWDKAEFEYAINRSFTSYRQQTNDVLFNLLDSHDTNRLMDKVGNDADVCLQQLTALYTMPGSPCIYYGTEIAMEGGRDPDCRRCMPWDEIEAGKYDDRIDAIKRLIALRKKHPALRSRNFHFPNDISDKRVIEYQKLDENEVVRVILNCGKNKIRLNETALAGIKEDDILFDCSYDGETLLPKGIIIYREK